MKARQSFVWCLGFVWACAWMTCVQGCEAAEIIEAAQPEQLPPEEHVDSGFCTQANEPECTGDEVDGSESGSESGGESGEALDLSDLVETCDPGDDLFAIYPHGCDPGCPGICTVDFRGRGLCCEAS